LGETHKQTMYIKLNRSKNNVESYYYWYQWM